MPPAPSPHDKLFRLALADKRTVLAELRAVLPTALAERLEPNSLEQLPGSFIDENLRASSSDLLFSAKLAGESALSYFLFEHKSETARTALLQLLSYISTVVPDLAPEKVSESLERALPERTNIMSTLAEKWLEEGERKGKEKGRRELVKRQLCLKFGSLVPAVEQKLDQASDAELDLVAERVLTATTLEQIFDN